MNWWIGVVVGIAVVLVGLAVAFSVVPGEMWGYEWGVLGPVPSPNVADYEIYLDGEYIKTVDRAMLVGPMLQYVGVEGETGIIDVDGHTLEVRAVDVVGPYKGTP